jgi:hypothetical protein
MKTINTKFRADIIYNTKGKFFTVEFIKRTDNTLRRMNARTGVKKHLVGGDQAYNPREKDLIVVFDMEKLAHRSIPIENIKKLKFAGTTYVFS